MTSGAPDGPDTDCKSIDLWVEDRSDDCVTVRTRIDQLERRIHMANWVAGGLAGGLLIVRSAPLAGAPDVLVKAIYTVIVIEAAIFAWVRIGFEWPATALKRRLEEDDELSDDDLIYDDEHWPSDRDLFWATFLILMLFLGVAIIAAIWWSGLDGVINSVCGSLIWPGIPGFVAG